MKKVLCEIAGIIMAHRPVSFRRKDYGRDQSYLMVKKLADIQFIHSNSLQPGFKGNFVKLIFAFYYIKKKKKHIS